MLLDAHSEEHAKTANKWSTLLTYSRYFNFSFSQSIIFAKRTHNNNTILANKRIDSCYLSGRRSGWEIQQEFLFQLQNFSHQKSDNEIHETILIEQGIVCSFWKYKSGNSKNTVDLLKTKSETK